MTDNSAGDKRRIVDTTAREARLAVAGVAALCEPLRSRIAIIAHRAKRSMTTDERRQLEDECENIRSSVAQARTDLMASLIDKPRKVLAHSRVTDIEKALDNLEA